MFFSKNCFRKLPRCISRGKLIPPLHMMHLSQAVLSRMPYCFIFLILNIDVYVFSLIADQFCNEPNGQYHHDKFHSYLLPLVRPGPLISIDAIIKNAAITWTHSYSFNFDIILFHLIKNPVVYCDRASWHQVHSAPIHGYNTVAYDFHHYNCLWAQYFYPPAHTNGI